MHPTLPVWGMGSYTDVLGQSDHPLVTFHPWGSLKQWTGRSLALRHWPQVREVSGFPSDLPGACGKSGENEGCLVPQSS